MFVSGRSPGGARGRLFEQRDTLSETGLAVLSGPVLYYWLSKNTGFSKILYLLDRSRKEKDFAIKNPGKTQKWNDF